MTDIVARLLDKCDRKYVNALCEEAAAEIERLRADLSFCSTRLAEIAKDHEQWERDYKHALKTENERLTADRERFNSRCHDLADMVTERDAEIVRLRGDNARQLSVETVSGLAETLEGK